MKAELTGSDKHLLRLIRKDKDAEGWTKVSHVVWPFVAVLPSELVELRLGDNGGYAKLTHDGETVLDWM